MIVVFAVGLFVIELITAEGARRSDVRRSAAAAAGVSAGLALALVAIAAVAPMPVYADNGTSLPDLWAAFDQAVFAGMATPILIWAANKVRLPQDRAGRIEELAIEFIEADIASATLAARVSDAQRSSKAVQ